jgi:uncharacterized protein YbjT (DUF2867 family)
MKNYVITGSTGHISRPIIEGLVRGGDYVSVISSSEERRAEIESLGAKALVGNVEDPLFVSQAFEGADVVYTMIPPLWTTTDWHASRNRIGENYAEALRANKIRHVVNLSSIGADVGKGTGPVDSDHDVEQMLNRIEGLAVRHLRPAYFFYNFLTQIPLIQEAGFMASNFGDGEKLFLVHTRDVASAALEELTQLSFTGSSARYIIGDERSGQEIADVIGGAINRSLHWVTFTDEEEEAGLIAAGLHKTHAEGYAKMGRAIRQGIMQRHARQTPLTFMPTKLENFATEFALAFNAQVQ